MKVPTALIKSPNPHEQGLVKAYCVETTDLGSVFKKVYILHEPTYVGHGIAKTDPLYYTKRVIHFVPKLY